MNSRDQVFGMLSIAARLLADAARELRGSGIAEPDSHLKAIAHALWNTQVTLRAVAEGQPALLPMMDESSAEKTYLDSWRDTNLPHIYKMAERGELLDAIEGLVLLARQAKNETDRQIALRELAHLIGIFA